MLLFIIPNIYEINSYLRFQSLNFKVLILDIFSVSGGYYNIELAGSKLRLVSLNMNLYLEEVAEETKIVHNVHRTKDPAQVLNIKIA